MIAIYALFTVALSALATTGVSLSAVTQQRMNHHCHKLRQELGIPPERHSGPAAKFWMKYWDPTWSCPMEEKIGHSFGTGDGGKWVCDAPLLKKNDCIVYSFGSLGEYGFEHGVQHRLGCETHVFDPFAWGKAPDSSTTHIFHHKYGVDSYSHDFDIGEYPISMKSIPDIIKSLGHTGKKIDILKIDVEGNEFGVIDNATVWSEIDALGVSIDQILIEVHFLGVNKKNFKFRPDAAQYTPIQMDGLFRFLAERGYAVFHKEANTISSGISCSEFSLVKLDLDCSNHSSAVARHPSPFLDTPEVL